MKWLTLRMRERSPSAQEREEIRRDAETAADRYLLSGGVPQYNPWPEGTARAVLWISYFLEATTVPFADQVPAPLQARP